MVSRLSWQDVIKRAPAIHPFVIEFPAYTKEEVIDIATLDCPADEDAHFYRAFTTTMYELVHRPCRNLNELRHLATLLFPKYLAPVKAGKCKFLFL